MKTLIALIPILLSVSGPAGNGQEDTGSENQPPETKGVVAVKNVCAWPNLTLMKDGTIIAILHNQPSHGQAEGDIDCWASQDGITWEKRSTVTRHEPDTVRMNHAAGLTASGDLVVLCSGWTNLKQPERKKQAAFRDDILKSWVLKSADGGRSWKQTTHFPDVEEGWSELIPFGDILADESGNLHVSCYHGKFKDPTASTRIAVWRSWLLTSSDDGDNWKKVSVIGPHHNETTLFHQGAGEWMAAARAANVDLIRSDDGGKTWGPGEAVTGRNEINGHLARLSEGRLLLSYGVRIDGRRGVCARISSDDGKTWSDPIRLAHTADGGDCGYPSSVQLKNGKIVTAWYSNDSPLYKGYHMGVTLWEAP